MEPDVRANGKSPDRLDLPTLLDGSSPKWEPTPEVQWTVISVLLESAFISPNTVRHLYQEKLGVYRDYRSPGVMTSPFAPIWINEMVRRQS
jgi:hypothetical protein